MLVFFVFGGCHTRAHAAIARARGVPENLICLKMTARGMDACRRPIAEHPFDETEPQNTMRAQLLDYRDATLFFFLAGAAAAPFGAGHGFWTP